MFRENLGVEITQIHIISVVDYWFIKVYTVYTVVLNILRENWQQQ